MGRLVQKYRNTVKKHLNNVVDALPKKVSAQQRLFVEQFYRKMPLIEFDAMEPDYAAHVALQAYEFIQQRKPGKAMVRIFQPEKKKHGWESPNLVLQVLNDDMPFLVDSVTSELQQHGILPERLIHPILAVERDAKGALKAVHDGALGKKDIVESCMHIELPVLPIGVTADFLENNLLKILSAVRRVVVDWEPMLSRCGEVEAYLQKGDFPVKQDETDEAVAFLKWLQDGNFIFLGAIEYSFYDARGGERMQVIDGSELGLFHVDDLELKPQGLTALPPEVRHFAMLPHVVEITKSNRKSIVHRPVHMDYIGFKRFDSQGKVIGEIRFLGLFTSQVYFQSALDIPVIRRKTSHLLQQAGFDPATHDGKALQAIIEFSPRDELFQMGATDLFNYAIGVLAVEANPDVHLFIRRDLFERFISCMVFVPRDLFNTALRKEIINIVEKETAGKITAFYTQMTDSPLARLHMIVKTKPGNIPTFSIPKLTSKISKVAYRWNDMLLSALRERHGESKGNQLFQRFGNAFGQDYISENDIKNAVFDIDRILEVLSLIHI